MWSLNLSAPRLVKDISGDFIIETKIFNGSRGKKSGGLLLWKDEDNFIRFEMPSNIFTLEGTVYFGAKKAGRFIHPGTHPFDAEPAWLRLERNGDRFTGYVSSDGERWYRCGWADISMEDPIKAGIHALCPLAPVTSTRFEYLRIYGPA